MHEFDREPQAVQRRTVAPTEPTDSHEVASYAPSRNPKAVHGEASLLHLQRTAGNASVVQMLAEEGSIMAEEERSPVHDVIGKGGGAPLDESTRSSMESRFGQDFSDVRVHTDSRASQSAEAVGAKVGKPISISEQSAPQPMPMFRKTMMMADAESAPTVAAGQMEINFFVNATFELV